MGNSAMKELSKIILIAGLARTILQIILLFNKFYLPLKPILFQCSISIPPENFTDHTFSGGIEWNIDSKQLLAVNYFLKKASS